VFGTPTFVGAADLAYICMYTVSDALGRLDSSFWFVLGLLLCLL
jgi:hypothetical protein